MLNFGSTLIYAMYVAIATFILTVTEETKVIDQKLL